MTAHLIRGDARNLPLATGSVQCVVTSPPYFGLRLYGGQASVWGGDPECDHSLANGPPLKPMTGGTGAASRKQLRNAGSQFGNAWAEQSSPRPDAGYSDKSTLAGFTSERTKGRQMATGSAWAEVDEYQNRGDATAGPKQKSNNGAVTGRGVIRHATCTLCGAWRGELGSEPTPALFVAHLVEVFREVKRVLRDDGVCFLNIGDSYSTGNPPGRRDTSNGKYGPVVVQDGSFDRSLAFRGGTRPKSLLLVPERLAIALADDGWIVRSRIAWCKAAPMPESARDRPTSAWEHIWMLTKQGRYYWDGAAVAEPAIHDGRVVKPYAADARAFEIGDESNDRRTATGFARGLKVGPTRNLWNYWLLPPDPYPGAHFATFPREIPRRCILAATSEHGACAACGAPWARTTARESTTYRPNSSGRGDNPSAFRSLGQPQQQHRTVKVTTTGWEPGCKCGPDAGVRPCVVLDPFSGSGTSAFVAAQLGRIGLGVELSEEYTKQARYGRLAQDFLPFGVTT